MSSSDDLKIFMNILAQSNSGLNDPHLIAKFSQAKAKLHLMDSANQIQAQNLAPQPSNPLPQATQSDQAIPSTPLGDTGLNPSENQANPTPAVGKYDNL
jgi:hypothetical protein